MSDHQTKTIETYHRLMNANAMAQAFLLARKVGVFEALKEGQKSAEELADQLELAPRPLELLLDQICETGYVEKYGDDYALSMLGKMLPVEWSDLGNRYWAQLENWLRQGERIEAEDVDFEKTEFGHESRAFEWMSTPNALDLIRLLNIGEGRKGLRLIELACGAAIFSSALAYQDPEMKVCLVDTRENLARAKSTTDSIDVSDRCQFVEADPIVFQAKFPADLILLANRLCRFDGGELKLLFTNAARQLNKQGEIVIVDEFSEQDESRFAQRNFGMLTELRTPKGTRRSKKEITDLLYECGFVDALYSDLKSPPGTKGVIVAGLA